LATAFDATRTTYLGDTRWDNLINVIKERTRSVLTTARAIEIWKTTAAAVSVTPTGLSATTGLGNLV
jgi:hypothetical protein